MTPSSPLGPATPVGRSSDAFADHPGYRRMFAPDALTLGLFLPLRFFNGDMRVLENQGALVSEADRRGFAAIWVRDVPLFDPAFGDAGQLFDPFTYLAWLAAHTTHAALATGSAIFSLRHPIDLAKAATSIDRLSGGRLILGIASGDRASEFPAYGLDSDQRAGRFAEAVPMFRRLVEETRPTIASPLGQMQGIDLLPKPVTGRIPLMVTGFSRQSMEWIGAQADGWLTYPEATHLPAGPRKLAGKIRSWRDSIPDQGFRPHMTNEWLDLVDDPDFPRTPVQGGFVLRTGRNGLIDLLREWRDAGVNHAALGIQFSARPAGEIIQELAEYMLPHFPSHAGPDPYPQHW